MFFNNFVSSFLFSAFSQVTASQVLGTLLALLACKALYWKRSTGVEAPFVGYRFSWEPPLLVHIRYVLGAASMIREGYAKVLHCSKVFVPRHDMIMTAGQWKDSMFHVSRYDGDVLLLSRKYLDDLHKRPEEELSAIHGLIRVSSKATVFHLGSQLTRNIRTLEANIVASLCSVSTMSGCEDFR
jgi:cytochrome P450 monooxygenase